MASMGEQFHQYYVPGDDALENAIKSGMVVPDTNVLLSLYRFQPVARENLFQALEKVADRLWAPHQVGFEFNERRLDVMRDQETYFSKTQKDLDDMANTLQGRVRNFRAQIALSQKSVEEIEDGITLLRDLLTEAIKKAEADNEVRLSNHASDDILARVLGMFPDGRMGDPMEPGEYEAVIKEAERRKQSKIPPGFMDKGPGDYLVWRQIMNEAKERKLPVVLVTDDRKEDWYWIYGGKTLGARRELRKELMDEAGVPLFIMTTDTFLRHADTYLGVPLNPETVSQVFHGRLANTGWIDDVRIYAEGHLEPGTPLEEQLAAQVDSARLTSVLEMLPRVDRELLLSMLTGEGIPPDDLGHLLSHPIQESVVLPELMITLGFSADELWEEARETSPMRARRIAELVLARLDGRAQGWLPAFDPVKDSALRRFYRSALPKRGVPRPDKWQRLDDDTPER